MSAGQSPPSLNGSHEELCVRRLGWFDSLDLLRLIYGPGAGERQTDKEGKKKGRTEKQCGNAVMSRLPAQKQQIISEVYFNWTVYRVQPLSRAKAHWSRAAPSGRPTSSQRSMKLHRLPSEDRPSAFHCMGQAGALGFGLRWQRDGATETSAAWRRGGPQRNQQPSETDKWNRGNKVYFSIEPKW
ncbi:hypothetical protein EYF80_012158 [Liparis tanakae]|uniref:Uncharacterized protein n=1 Tax=Liparis tanakae TaxID=230148 RepID=A0A4Z2II84_9TELE|nr:hypothetical protein EYF80_012158 [Liparis tanakae]